MEEKGGRETVVKEEKVELGRVAETAETEEGDKGETEDKWVAEEKDCVEGADAREEEKRAEGTEVKE